MKLEKTIDRSNWTQRDAINSAIDAIVYYAKKDSSSQQIMDLAHWLTSEVVDTSSQMMAIRNWILANLTYIKDEDEALALYGVEHPEGVELVKSPIAVLESKHYDCDCGSGLILSILMVLGIKARLVVVGFQPESISGPSGFDHVFVQGHDPTRDCWITIDPVSYPNETKMLEDTRQYKTIEIN